MTFEDWIKKHPAAAADLDIVHQGLTPVSKVSPGPTEAWAQQQARMEIARAGGLAWRNNVGATPARCDDCGARQQPVRYGLANDSGRLNAVFKSSDLIGVVPRLIEPEDVGRTIGQFLAVECKRPGWHYANSEHERAQANWLDLVASKGGLALFSTGGVPL